MKVFRPKTCCYLKATEDEEAVCSFDRKWRFIKQSKVSPMDLAICWDMTPENSQDEPKRPTHIDGSNGSAAPAVFSLVHSPKDEEEPSHKCDGIHGCDPLFEHSAKELGNKEYFFHRSKRSSVESKDSVGGSIKERAKSANDKELGKSDPKGASIDKRGKSAHPSYHRNSVKSEGSDTSGIGSADHNCSYEHSVNSKNNVAICNRSKSAVNLTENRKKTVTKECNNNIHDYIHHSTPNLGDKGKCFHTNSCRGLGRLTNKICVACELRNTSLTEKRPKTEYKMAFKAGIPQKNVSRCYDYFLKIPKQKTPYKLRNYVIDSLAPPFSLQKARREEYPEHWRLATVYQHSYKPIHTRKRSLLQTVFK